MRSTRPLTILIAALGGEGGGVLTQWIVSAAAQAGFPVQSTSIPGVAQRTGATTYYIEIFPVRTEELGDKRPVLALTPGVGDIDIAVASELLEAGRAVSNGFVTPARTCLISSINRSYAMEEKIAMSDGRFDQQKLMKAVTDHARSTVFLDMNTLAQQAGSIVNAVMLGAIAGCGRLPLTTNQFEAAIRDDGKALDVNLRGFRAGYEAAQMHLPPIKSPEHKTNAAATPALVEHEVARTFPAAAQATGLEGIRRLVNYQSVSYGRLYLDRLRPIIEADQFSGAQGRLVTAVARNLAVRMSYEDVVRVAQAKIAPHRIRRIAREELRANGEPFSVQDFLKPGIEELCQLLPSFVARPILRIAERKGWLGRVYFGMQINSTSVTGYLRLLLLAKLRWFRPYGYRYRQEQQQIDSWLALVREATKHSLQLALEVAECARLIKGYGDTHSRGLANFALIESRVIRPALDGQIPMGRSADAVASARTAALLDPDGEALAKCIAEIHARPPVPIAAE
ncbi:MAG TPA: indolepyruvate oxidoreductase subunit beta family protein [Pseudolabrys sp.]|nr:indolepyruvate oxidoreductase subunit beta family protein [Pseudolabrys sp.]